MYHLAIIKVITNLLVRINQGCIGEDFISGKDNVHLRVSNNYFNAKTNMFKFVHFL